MPSARTTANPLPPPGPIFSMSYSSCSGADHAQPGRPCARSPLGLGTMCWRPARVVAVIPISKATVLSPAPSLPAPQRAGLALGHGHDTSSRAGAGEEAHPADPGAAAAHRQPEGDRPGAEERPAGECHRHAAPGTGAALLPAAAFRHCGRRKGHHCSLRPGGWGWVCGDSPQQMDREPKRDGEPCPEQLWSRGCVGRSGHSVPMRKPIWEADEGFGLHSPENKRLDPANRQDFTCQEHVGGMRWVTHRSWGSGQVGARLSRSVAQSSCSRVVI